MGKGWEAQWASAKFMKKFLSLQHLIFLDKGFDYMWETDDILWHQNGNSNRIAARMCYLGDRGMPQKQGIGIYHLSSQMYS